MIDIERKISAVSYNNKNMPLAIQEKEIQPTTEEQVITGDDGYNLSKVTIKAVTKDIDENIQSGNIKAGVSILGVEGVLEGNKLPDVLNKTVTSLTAGDLIGVTQIPNYAFQNCIDLASVEFSSILQTIGSYAFYGCRSLTSIDFGENSQLTSIGTSAFNNCRGLTSINLSNCTNLTSIGSSAFSDCRGLTSITFPSSLGTIGDYAFYRCEGLTSITLPSSLTSIGAYAFRSCTSLTTMRVEATTPPTLSTTNAISTATTRIEVPMASVDAYKAATNWSNFADIIVGYTE